MSVGSIQVHARLFCHDLNERVSSYLWLEPYSEGVITRAAYGADSGIIKSDWTIAELVELLSVDKAKLLEMVRAAKEPKEASDVDCGA